MNFIRILVLCAVQVFLFKNIQIFSDSIQYIYIIVYPLGILLLPLSVPQFFVLIIGFVSGFMIDIFYGSLGVHSGAMLWMIAFRPMILSYLEPKTGYSAGQYPSAYSLGIFWFLKYIILNLSIFFLFYFTLELFSWVYFGTILIKTVVSLFVSSLIIFLVQIIWNPKS